MDELNKCWKENVKNRLTFSSTRIRDQDPGTKNSKSGSEILLKIWFSTGIFFSFINFENFIASSFFDIAKSDTVSA